MKWDDPYECTDSHDHGIAIKMKKGMHIRSVSRFISVLNSISRDGPLSLGQMVRSTGISYPTMSRIVHTLVNEELVVQVTGTKTYRVAAMAMSLSASFQTPQLVAAVAKPVMEALTRDIGWPLTVNTRVGINMVVQASTHHRTSLTLNDCPPGATIPVLYSASGHAYLAFADAVEQQCVLDSMHVFEKVTPMLSMFLDGRPQARIRADGYATYERNKHARGPGKTSAISVPLLQDNRFVAVLSLVFFSSAMSLGDALQRYLSPLREAADTIGELLSDSPIESVPMEVRSPRAAPSRSQSSSMPFARPSPESVVSLELRDRRV